MSRYEQFQEEQSSVSSNVDLEQTQNELVCIKNLLPKANPLMDKIQFTPYEPKNYYPVHLVRLPPLLSNHHYHLDPNNMNLIDEAIFSHHKMKKDIANFLATQKAVHQYHRQLLTLKQFYAGKALIYQKFSSTAHSNYFATYILKMNAMCKQTNEKMGKSGFIIRNTRTPILTERCRTERLSLVCKPQIDFNSNFECGNLYKVYQREYNEYDLILQNDINTRGNNQWFFFSVKNVPKGTTVKFNIVNMAKRYSLFDYGMKPSVFSLMKFEKRKIAWVRDGAKVTYSESNELRRENSSSPYFTLSFQYKFTYEGDIVYFSYSIPYTFSNLCSYLVNKLSDRNYHAKVKVRSLGHTLGGNEVNLLQLTNTQSRADKKAIWILGRQHSGEVTSSFMVEGIIDFLLSDCPQAEYLMNYYYFRIVPMLNIDGVVHGNTRAELSGVDPNRKWADPSKIYQPIIYSIKKMIEKDSVEMILDLHSHSRKLGTFFYCNSSPQYSNMIKIFPMLVCKNDERFDYRSNRFRGGNNQTARRVFYQILNIPYIYTIESSLFGYQRQNDFRIIPYQPNDYRDMGKTVLSTFAEMTKKKKGLNQKDYQLLICNQNQLEQEDNLWNKMNQVDELQSIGSDEDPAADQLSKKELDAILEKKSKKKIKSKKAKIPKQVKIEKKVEQPKKQDQPKPRKNDKDSYYKQFFSGRSSLNAKQHQHLFQVVRPRPEMKNFACQVDIAEKAVLHKSSMNVMTTRQISTERLFQKKSLCVVGQKVEDDLTISGCSVGVQAEVLKSFLKHRNEVMLENKNVRRVFKSSNRIANIALHNQNNFLNKGDILHTALRMLNKR